jgi:uncharacterized protein YjbI with pentapeptide repeats
VQFARRAALLMVVVLAAAACSETTVPDDEFGDCKVEPGAVCRDQDLRSISLVAADLQGVDLSGSDLSNADLRDSNLTGAKFVGSILAGTNFGGANLTNADLTNAFMFGTNLTDADLTGANTQGMQRCQVTEPDGKYTSGEVLDPEGRPVPCTGGPTGTAPAPGATSTSAPATVEYFRQANPKRCINDISGTGIDITWSVKNATSINLFVDGIRIQSSTKPKATMRVPFFCDGEIHIVGLQASGSTGPRAEASFTAAHENTAPLTAED